MRPLPWSDLFSIPADTIYLDGNSLGLMPRRVASDAGRLIAHEWGERAIASWNEAWLQRWRDVGEKVGHIVGAESGETIIADTTSLNLYKLACAGLQARPDRRVILTDDDNFPSDLYCLQGALDAYCPRGKLKVVKPHEVAESISEQVALVSLSHVAFKSGLLHDMEPINALAREAGALTLWDLSHSAGSVVIDIAKSGADMAVGCTYKHLNGGPGSPAYLWVRRSLADELASPIPAWLGHSQPFAFEQVYEPATGVDRFRGGTPPMLSLTALEAGLNILIEAGMENVQAQNSALTQALLDADIESLGFKLLTPREPKRRGAHVSYEHPEAWRICQCLIQKHKIVPDFRAPSAIRFGVASLYNSLDEIAQTVSTLRQVVEAKEYEQMPTERPTVT